MKSDLESLSQMAKMRSLRLQTAIEGLSKAMSTLSRRLKKQSDTANGIDQNLK